MTAVMNWKPLLTDYCHQVTNQRSAFYNFTLYWPIRDQLSIALLIIDQSQARFWVEKLLLSLWWMNMRCQCLPGENWPITAQSCEHSTNHSSAFMLIFVRIANKMIEISEILRDNVTMDELIPAASLVSHWPITAQHFLIMTNPRLLQLEWSSLVDTSCHTWSSSRRRRFRSSWGRRDWRWIRRGRWCLRWRFMSWELRPTMGWSDCWSQAAGLLFWLLTGNQTNLKFKKIFNFKIL